MNDRVPKFHRLIASGKNDHRVGSVRRVGRDAIPVGGKPRQMVAIQRCAAGRPCRTIGNMTPGPPYDPRAVANLLLDALDRRGRAATHIDLQKLLYFAHGRFVVGFDAPLVTGYFEAWAYGPVHPGLYRSFKAAGRRPITFRAESTDFVTGENSIVRAPDSQLLRDELDLVALHYGRLSTSQLIELSHASEGPWDLTVRRAKQQVTLGMRISDDVIKLAFQRHKMSIRSSLTVGDAVEDTPFTDDGLRKYVPIAPRNQA